MGSAVLTSNRGTKMRNEINLTGEQIEALFDKAFGAGVNMDEEYGVDVVFTRDTLEQFDAASNGYAECNRPVFGEVGGLRTMLLARAQPRKGDQRRDVHIIDFGTVRAVYQ
jgi:hypothetical protein